MDNRKKQEIQEYFSKIEAPTGNAMAEAVINRDTKKFIYLCNVVNYIPTEDFEINVYEGVESKEEKTVQESSERVSGPSSLEKTVKLESLEQFVKAVEKNGEGEVTYNIISYKEGNITIERIYSSGKTVFKDMPGGIGSELDAGVYFRDNTLDNIQFLLSSGKIISPTKHGRTNIKFRIEISGESTLRNESSYNHNNLMNQRPFKEGNSSLLELTEEDADLLFANENDYNMQENMEAYSNFKEDLKRDPYEAEIIDDNFRCETDPNYKSRIVDEDDQESDLPF